MHAIHQRMSEYIHTARFLLFFTSFAALFSMGMTAHASVDNLQALRQDAAIWLKQQVAKTYPQAQSTVEIGALDKRLRLQACERYDYFLPAGARLWSGGSMGVRCRAPSPWTLYLTYNVQLTGSALTVQSPLPSRHLLAPKDVSSSLVRFEQDPGLYLLSIPTGAITQRPLAANQPLLIQDLVLPDVIRAGARVRVRVQGEGFTVSQEGKALNAAKAGGSVQVKMPTGRIVRGMANQAGEVEIQP